MKSGKLEPRGEDFEGWGVNEDCFLGTFATNIEMMLPKPGIWSVFQEGLNFLNAIKWGSENEEKLEILPWHLIEKLPTIGAEEEKFVEEPGVDTDDVQEEEAGGD